MKPIARQFLAYATRSGFVFFTMLYMCSTAQGFSLAVCHHTVGFVIDLGLTHIKYVFGTLKYTIIGGLDILQMPL